MDWRRSDDSAERFSAYLQELASVIGHAARIEPMRAFGQEAETDALDLIDRNYGRSFPRR